MSIKVLWNFYSTSPHSQNPIPKLFESKTIQPIFKLILRYTTLEKLGRDLPRENNDNIGNSSDNGVEALGAAGILISGVRGVGKTTLMTGFTRILTAACKHVFAVYCDYEQAVEHKPPSQLILEQLKARRPEIWDKVQSITDCIELLDKLQSLRTYVAFFADEIQELYKADASRECPEVSCVKELLSIGKSPNCFGVISGSSAKIASLAIRKDPGVEYREYPNLNNSVYREMKLLPLRDKEELQKLLEVRYPPLATAVEQVFVETGGVGRNIDRYNEQISHEDLLAHMGLPPFLAEMRSTLQLYIPDDELMRTLNDWIDSGLLYGNEMRGYELLIPKHYQDVKLFLTDYPDQLTMMALEGMCQRDVHQKTAFCLTARVPPAFQNIELPATMLIYDRGSQSRPLCKCVNSVRRAAVLRRGPRIRRRRA